MWLLFAINAVLIFGYATFSLHSDWISAFPAFSAVYDSAFPFFTRLQILIGFWLCVRACQRAMGFRWILFLVAAFGISLTTAFLGTAYGIPFGKYSYTGLLGWRIAGMVPLLIPVGWFSMSVGSYVLALQLLGPASMQIFRRTTNHWYRSAQRVALASLLLLALGITLEPVMSTLVPCWIWEGSGAFFFPPAVRNLLAWMVTGVFIFVSFEFFRMRDGSHRFELSWAPKFYMLYFSMPLGLLIVGAVWLPVALALAILLGCDLFARKKGAMKRGIFIRTRS